MQHDNPLYRIPEELIIDLAKSYGTPYYLIDERTIRRKISELKTAYSGYSGEVVIAYSIKANFTPKILRIFHENGLMFDVATIEELYFLSKATGSVDRSIYTSVTQTYSEFYKAIREGVRLFVIGSLHGLNNLEKAAKELETKVNVLVRINPEVYNDRSSIDYVKSGKFGVPVVDNMGEDALSLMRRLEISDWLVYSGFHFHIGTQVLDAGKFALAIEKIISLEELIRDEGLNLETSVIDIGGGLPVSYDNEDVSVTDISSVVIPRLEKLSGLLKKSPKLIIESGRFLIAEAGILVSRIVNIKRYNGKRYVYLDTGYHNLLDSVLVKQVYPIRIVPGSKSDCLPSDDKQGGDNEIMLVGMLCDMDDIFRYSRSSVIDDVEVGKYVVFGNVGAYSIVFNMPFHSQVKPPVLLLRSNGEVEIARQRQNIDNLFVEEGGDLL